MEMSTTAKNKTSSGWIYTTAPDAQFWIVACHRVVFFDFLLTSYLLVWLIKINSLHKFLKPSEWSTFHFVSYFGPRREADIPLDMGVFSCSSQEAESTRADTPPQEMVSSSQTTPPPKTNKVSTHSGATLNKVSTICLVLEPVIISFACVTIVLFSNKSGAEEDFVLLMWH